MRARVLFAHPAADSVAAAAHHAVLRGRGRAGCSIDDADLYRDGFAPCMSAEERRDYNDVARNLRRACS